MSTKQTHMAEVPRSVIDVVPDNFVDDLVEVAGRHGFEDVETLSLSDEEGVDALLRRLSNGSAPEFLEDHYSDHGVIPKDRISHGFLRALVRARATVDSVEQTVIYFEQIDPRKISYSGLYAALV